MCAVSVSLTALDRELTGQNLDHIFVLSSNRLDITLEVDTNAFSVSVRKKSCSEMAEVNGQIGVETCKTDLIRR